MRDVACREHAGRRRTVAFQRAAKGVAAQAPRTGQEPRAFQPFDIALSAERNDDQIGVDPRAVPQDYRCDGTGTTGLDPLDASPSRKSTP